MRCVEFLGERGLIEGVMKNTHGENNINDRLLPPHLGKEKVTVACKKHGEAGYELYIWEITKGTVRYAGNERHEP